MAVAVTACAEVLGNLDRIVAIEIRGGTRWSVEEGDTLTLHAFAVTARGDSAPDAVITWALVDVDSGQVGFTIDSASGLVTAHAPGSGRVIARTETLRAGPDTVTVTPAPDSIAPTAGARLAADTTLLGSPPISVTVFDLTTAPGTALPLPGVTVTFALIDPAPGSPTAEPFFIAGTDTVPAADPQVFVVVTGASGSAAGVLWHQAGLALPDSAVVGATVTTATGAPVTGSPVRFVIVYRGN